MIGGPCEADSSLLRLEIGAAAPPDWETLVAADPAADFFHTRRWTETVAACYPDLDALWLTARADERLVAGLSILQSVGRRVERLESSFDGTSGGPVVAGDLPVDFATSLFHLLVDRFHQMRSGPLGLLSLSLNEGHEARFGPGLRGDGHWRRHDHPAAVISLEGGIEEVQTSRLKKTKRNERNRAAKRGVTTEVTRDPGAVAEYYPIYLRATDRWGVRPTPLEMLQGLLAGNERTGPGVGDAFFTVARLGDRVVGGHLNLVYGDRVIAWSGVTDPDYSREFFPATAAICADLVESCRRGARWLDLGGSGGAAKLGDFKRYFGAEEQERGWYTSETAALRALRFLRDRWRGVRGGKAERSP